LGSWGSEWFNLETGTLRLHDVMRAYLSGRLLTPAAAHARLVDALGDPHDLPDDYAWHWYAYHLVGAGRLDRLRQLLLDFNWIQAKLEATDATALISDYDAANVAAGFSRARRDLQISSGGVAGGAAGGEVRLVQDALRLSAHVLARDKTQLASQLIGRLLSSPSSGIRSLIAQAAQFHDVPWLKPETASLTAPGGPLVRTLEGDTREVEAVAIAPHGQRAVFASDDGTLSVWDLEQGELRQRLEGHTDAVRAVAMTPDVKRAVSASDDRTLKVWDLSTGRKRGRWRATPTGSGQWPSRRMAAAPSPHPMTRR
jgi:WD40 repeat protein